MEVRHYGPVVAKIDDVRQRVTVSVTRRGRQPVSPGQLRRLYRWAVDQAESWWLEGYIVTVDPGPMLEDG